MTSIEIEIKSGGKVFFECIEFETPEALNEFEIEKYLIRWKILTRKALSCVTTYINIDLDTLEEIAPALNDVLNVQESDTTGGASNSAVD